MKMTKSLFKQFDKDRKELEKWLIDLDTVYLKKEFIELSDVLHGLELQTLRYTGVGKINGGYAEADMFDYDDDYFDVELKWGEQDMGDGHSSQYVENYKIARDGKWEIQSA